MSFKVTVYIGVVTNIIVTIIDNKNMGQTLRLSGEGGIGNILLQAQCRTRNK